MQKTNLLIIAVLATLLVSSALSVAAAQETTPTPTHDDSVTTDPTVNPDETINPDNLRDMYDNTGDGLLYTIQGENSTDSNATDTNGQEPMPYGDEVYANGLADETAANDNTTLYITIAGVVAAVAVGGAIGIVYFRKNRTTN